MGLNLAPVLASAGVLGIAFGFGAQNLVRDFLSGVSRSADTHRGGAGNPVRAGPDTRHPHAGRHAGDRPASGDRPRDYLVPGRFPPVSDLRSARPGRRAAYRDPRADRRRGRGRSGRLNGHPAGDPAVDHPIGARLLQFCPGAEAVVRTTGTGEVGPATGPPARVRSSRCATPAAGTTPGAARTASAPLRRPADVISPPVPATPACDPLPVVIQTARDALPGWPRGLRYVGSGIRRHFIGAAARGIARRQVPASGADPGRPDRVAAR